MRKLSYIISFLFGVIQVTNAQVKPLEIYSSKRFWKSDKTKTGTGFKFRTATNVKRELLFTIYKDHITLTNKKDIIYKINKIDAKYTDATHYLVSDLHKQSYAITIDDDVIDKKHIYGITIIKTAKDGKYLSVTRFDVNKIK